MFTKSISNLWSGAAFAGILALGSTGSAVTVNLDGSTYTTLSAAVAAAYAAEDGPDIINITVDSLPTPDGQVVLDKPITINGDAENAGVGNGVQCDILVDMTGIIGAADLGSSGKSYIEVRTPGEVVINDIRIHPNEDGAFVTGASSSQIVSGIRIFRPLLTSDVSNVALTNVYVSGSDSSNAYVAADSGNDLYNQSGIKRWGGQDGADGAVAAHGAIHVSNADSATAGIVNVTLDHCHAALTKALALSIPAEGGSVTVLGGLFGHSARDGIRVSGTSVTLQGTATDRLRIVRSTNIAAANSHGLEVVAGGTIPLLEYVDVAGCNTANGFNFRGGNVEVMRYCRALGKFLDAANEQVFITGANQTIGVIEDSTFVGMGANPNPIQFVNAYVDPVTVRDVIFTSHNFGVVVNNATTGTVTYDHCALPIDGVTSESLANPPFSGGSGGPQDLSDPTVIAPMLQSPQYLLTLADYDWSNNQGTGVIGNGPGNINVLRPSNLAYLTAGSGGTALTGGAGPLVSGIDAGTWMLME